MIEAEEVAELVREDGFQVVGAGVRGERCGSRERRVRVGGQEQNICIQDFAYKCGGRAAGRKLLADDVRRNDARERQDTQSEPRVILIEANDIEPVGGLACRRRPWLPAVDSGKVCLGLRAMRRSELGRILEVLAQCLLVAPHFNKPVPKATVREACRQVQD